MTVDRLHPVLVHHLVNSLGWRSLRPLQHQAVAPLLDGADAVLLAPTAGGKTEAAMFPLLTAMEQQGWSGLSVVYVCPLKALLNNLTPRLESYGAWLGRRAAVWHGDVGASARRRILRDPPDVLLTTPESLEAMLVSVKVDHHRLFAGLRAVVVDEVHAFAGDDRGWHLLAVLERLARVCGRPVQRIGLSATVGNPSELLAWLQGTGRGSREATVVAPEAAPAAEIDVELDHVGSVDNAATVLAALHRGEKRLVFCDSRALVEKLGAALRERGVTTFLSHASLSVEERRRAEQAFAEARNCVIVSTSTLELGIDVGDLDRVVQVNAPTTVASFLQRLGRTGRRAGATRNCLFLALDKHSLLWSAGLLQLWAGGYVEPVTAPPQPRHIVAQQLLALCLQEGTVGSRLWAQTWNGLAPFDRSAEPIVTHLLDEGFVERDGELLFIGPQAEQRFGRRHFMGMTAVFTAPPQFTVVEGRREIGHVDPSLLTDRVEGPRLLLLAGRSWRVTWVDWTRQRCFVEAVDAGGRARWHTGGVGGASFTLARAAREVLLGADPPVALTKRAVRALGQIRDEQIATVHPGGTVILRHGGEVRWWTWAGYRANATLAATVSDLVDATQRADDVSIRLRGDLTPQMWRGATADAAERLCLPDVDRRALDGLKFSEALPERLATMTLAARLADLDGAARVLAEPTRMVGS
ncbi:DEAD/DEAH box helicase [Pseudonocardia asaccharolytica]|uniref:ATP-dependent helicase n=1 Tax=Pseudonocardia asaccharolytica DSM 44247 = NBRC 16224 TaxID=1123024 RepID=A0A511CYF7_9PSEU|nr:DEAD/DEAH box helicase [Pseudonocardia asaccharolytica]GEL17283.1 ATP-dependent helicase [Pseudonocardia asaccharolytica DSM 44247 = NBRC 16224]